MMCEVNPQVIVTRHVKNVSIRSSANNGAYLWVTEDNGKMVMEAIVPASSPDSARIVIRVPKEAFAEFARACVEMSENG